MQLQITNYHMANEILYALDAIEKTRVKYLSRLTIQKILYLAGALAPLKNISLEYLKFNSEKMGPYKGNIQNTLDHLVGIGLSDILDFEKTILGALSSYRISITGKEVVSRLTRYPYEEEKAWWISLISELAYSYLILDDISGTVDEKIKSIVYQDPTYTTYKKRNLFRQLIDLSDESGLTYQYSDFLKSYVHDSDVIPINLTERKQVEIMLVTFMEYLYTGVLNEVSNESSKA